MAYCVKMQIGDTVGIVRLSGKRPPACHWCGNLSTKLCDYVISSPQVVTHKRTCDAPMCDEHALAVGSNQDYCPDHRIKAMQKTMVLPTTEELKQVLREVYKQQHHIVVGQPMHPKLQLSPGSTTTMVLGIEMGVPFLVFANATADEWNRQLALIGHLRPIWPEQPPAIEGTFFRVVPKQSRVVTRKRA